MSKFRVGGSACYCSPDDACSHGRNPEDGIVFLIDAMHIFDGFFADDAFYPFFSVGIVVNAFIIANPEEWARTWSKSIYRVVP